MGLQLPLSQWVQHRNDSRCGFAGNSLDIVGASRITSYLDEVVWPRYS